MTRRLFAARWLLAGLLALTVATAGRAGAESPAKKDGAEKQPARPIKALLVTGGCCHDYARQKLIITRGVSARADVEWTVVHQGGTTTDTKIPLYEDPNWAEGFDIVVHNECFSNVKDVEWVERILKPHREGTPAVLIHCAMHCYRTGDDRWFEFCGMQSPGHGPQYAYTVKNVKPDHPIMKGFGEQWQTPRGELYHSVKLFPKATALGQAARKSDNVAQTCVWTNQYGKARVFATTIGHHNETMAEPTYLDMLARGILWATGRLDETDIRPTDKKTDEAIMDLVVAPVEQSKADSSQLPQACCGMGNLTFKQPTKASSEETGKKNFAKNAVDGDLRTRWCANGGRGGEWWQVDLGEPKTVKNVRIHWEKSGTAYRYTVDASTDGQSWRTIVDRSKNDKPARITPHMIDADSNEKARFLRVTFLGASTGVWGSLWEFEAYDGELPELPKGITQSESGAAASVSDVEVPDGFEVRLFGVPPEVNYPVCLAAAPTGEVFVGVDEQGSLGKEPNRGKVLRCQDIDGDGRADEIKTFCKVDHPRGLIYDAGSLWVLHPPTLSVYHDDNHDGTADRHETLITGISTRQVAKRGADHTTNGIRMGIDGWIYIAVGDFGFVNAKGTDGTTLSKRGGGIVRVRPDGTEMEVYSWGQRNILDVSLDPYLNGFTRDNTNDGGGWNVRLSHILQSADYGYPSKFLNFTDEIMPPLADYGGGSGCGSIFLHDLRWPEPFGNSLYTCDWGRSEVYRHELTPTGPTFTATAQHTFLKIPRPTDIDVDGSGRMYVSSWKGGQFNYAGPNIGFVAQIVPQNFLPKPFPNLAAMTDAELLEELAHPSAVHQLHAQRELLRRGRSAERTQALVAMASDESQPLYGRVAAVFTLKQLDGADANAALAKLTGDAALREFALRALADRKSQLDSVPVEPFLAGLKDDDPRVQAQAVIGLGRLGRSDVVADLLPLTVRDEKHQPPTKQPLHAQPDPGRVIPHLAVQALVELNAMEACLAALDGPYRSGALWALRSMHDPAAVDGLIAQLNRTSDPARRGELLGVLIRLYHREGDYVKGDWWGTRPDTSGPYYDRQEWTASKRIADVVRTAVREADAEPAKKLLAKLARHKVVIDGLPKPEELASTQPDEPQMPIEIPKVDSDDPNLIANLSYEAAAQRALKSAGDPGRGRALFERQACVACHTSAEGQKPKGPHLVDIGQRYKRPELIESILKPSNKIAQGFDSYLFLLASGKTESGFVVSESAETVEIRRADGTAQKLPQKEIELRKKQEKSMMPTGIVNNLTPEQLADLLAYLESLTK